MHARSNHCLNLIAYHFRGSIFLVIRSIINVPPKWTAPQICNEIIANKWYFTPAKLMFINLKEILSIDLREWEAISLCIDSILCALHLCCYNRVIISKFRTAFLWHSGQIVNCLKIFYRLLILLKKVNLDLTDFRCLQLLHISLQMLFDRSDELKILK